MEMTLLGSLRKPRDCSQVPSDDVRERLQASRDVVKEHFRTLMMKDRLHHVCSFLLCLGECVKLITSEFVHVVWTEGEVCFEEVAC